MTKRRKILLWVGLILSLPLSAYAGLCVVFYAWMNAAEPERWPSEKAAIWVYSSLTLACCLFLLFCYCLVSLIKNQNRENPAE